MVKLDEISNPSRISSHTSSRKVNPPKPSRNPAVSTSSAKTIHEITTPKLPEISRTAPNTKFIQPRKISREDFFVEDLPEHKTYSDFNSDPADLIDNSREKSIASTPSAQKSHLKKHRLPAKNPHKLLTKFRILRNGLRNFVRNIWLTAAATAVMTITLLMLFATVIASQILDSTLVKMREKIDISIYLKSATPETELQALVAKLQRLANVKTATYKTNRDAYNDYLKNNQGANLSPDDQQQAVNLITEAGIDPANSFPAIIKVKLNNLDDLTSLKNLVNEDKDFATWLSPDFTQFDDGEAKTIIDTISRWTILARRVGLIAASIFLAISILVIFNTIRMAIFARREEIEIMRLIGAQRKFIRGAFLVEAETYGVFAGIIAFALGYAIYFRWLATALENYGVAMADTNQILVNFWPVILAIFILIGVFIGGVSARLAVRRYLK